LTAPERFDIIARMPRSPLLAAAVLLAACHGGVPFEITDGPPAATDGPPGFEVCGGFCGIPGPDAGADLAGPDGPSPDGSIPDAPIPDAPPPDMAALAPDVAPGIDVPGDAVTPPSAACPATPVPETCLAGSARCGGTGCVPLDTDQNCGRCGRTCGDSFCQAFECRPVQVAASPTGALALAVNSRAVFWGTGSGEIWKRTFADGAVAQVAANEGRVMALLADETSLYVLAKEGLKCPQNACLWRTSAGTPGAREPIAERGVYTGGLIQDAEALYSFDSGAITRIEKMGLARRELSTGEGSDVGLAADDQYIYWGSDAGGEGMIKRAAKDGKTPPRPLVRGLTRALGVAVDGHHVYWTDGGTRLVQRAPKEGGTPTTLVSHADPLAVPVTITVSDHDVYFSMTGGNRGLRKVPRCGGDLHILDGAGMPAIVPWKGDVFWADDERGIFRVAQ